MKGSIVAVLLACVCVGPISAGASETPSQSSNVVAALTQLEQEWENAVQARDVNRLSEIEADDWRSVGLDGHIWTKQDDLSGLKSGKVKHVLAKLGPLNVKVFGDDVAVVQGTFTDGRTADRGNTGAATTYAFMDVFMNRENKWMVVRSLTAKLK